MAFGAPKVFAYLFDAARHKGAHGGRGSAKSHSYAAALVQNAFDHRELVGCFREIQGSIKDSVKKLIENKIDEAGLKRHCICTETEIRVLHTKSLFIFKGLRTNPDSVKSTEGITKAWTEEADTVSQTSINLLTPTVRENGSELWWTWNPKLSSAPVDAMLRGNDDKNQEIARKLGKPFEPPPGAIVREFNYEDNPFFDESPLREEMEYDRGRDPEKYNHVWRGKYLQRSEARVFKNWRVEEFETPEGFYAPVFYYGADWGFSIDPSVLVRCWIDEATRKLYVDQEVYQVGCDIDHLPKLFAGKDGATKEELKTWTVAMDAAWPGVPGARKYQIVADSARPETISYMQRQGFNIEPAIKGAGSVEEGVEFLQNYDIIVHPRCRHTIDELSFYSWKTDPLTDKILPFLADKHNHVIDALRYACEGVRNNAGAVWEKIGRNIQAERNADAARRAVRR